MTYLEVMSILNTDEEAGQPALSSENDNACDVSKLTKNKK